MDGDVKLGTLNAAVNSKIYICCDLLLLSLVLLPERWEYEWYKKSKFVVTLSSNCEYFSSAFRVDFLGQVTSVKILLIFLPNFEMTRRRNEEG